MYTTERFTLHTVDLGFSLHADDFGAVDTDGAFLAAETERFIDYVDGGLREFDHVDCLFGVDFWITQYVLNGARVSVSMLLFGKFHEFSLGWR